MVAVSILFFCTVINDPQAKALKQPSLLFPSSVGQEKEKILFLAFRSSHVPCLGSSFIFKASHHSG